MNYSTLNVRLQDSVRFIEIYRPQASNAINGELVRKCDHVLSACENSAAVVLLRE